MLGLQERDVIIDDVMQWWQVRMISHCEWSHTTCIIILLLQLQSVLPLHCLSSLHCRLNLRKLIVPMLKVLHQGLGMFVEVRLLGADSSKPKGLAIWYGRLCVLWVATSYV